MRMKLILTVAVITIVSAGATYFFLQGNSAVEQAVETTPLIRSIANVDRKSISISDEQHDLPQNSTQRQLELINDKIVALETRLRYLEVSVNEQAKNRAVSSSSSSPPSNSIEKTKEEHSEINFGHQVDQSLDTGHFNYDKTIKVMEQAEKSLAKIPDITLDDVQCDERFCRATIVPEYGKQLNTSQILDLSSNFMESGTAVEKPDGSVKIYFTHADQSLTEP